MAFKVTRNLGMIFLAMYLLVVGLTGIAQYMGRYSFPPVVWAVLALVAGVLILVGK
jgi:hypothetical protein